MLLTESMKYLPPGETRAEWTPSPWVRMGVVPVEGGDVVWMDFDEKEDSYIAWPSWSPDSKTLRVQWMNRGQDTLRFFDCDPTTGEKVQVFEETQDTWVDWFNNIYYLGELLHPGAVETDTHQLRVPTLVRAAGEVDPAAGVIDLVDRVDPPLARGHGAGIEIVVVDVDVVPARPVRQLGRRHPQ